MTTTTTSATNAERPPIQSVHHPAFRCFDAEETRHFYEDILEVPLYAACLFDNDGVGNKIDYMHLFHRMSKGDFLAFFDLPERADPEIFSAYNSLEIRAALRVSTEAELDELVKRLAAAGVACSGPTDHGFMKSIYFTDPNGLHLEVSVPHPRHDEILAGEKARAKDVLAEWIAKTETGRSEGH